MPQHRPVVLLEHVAPHVDHAVRVHAEDVVVVGGVVDLAEREAVRAVRGLKPALGGDLGRRRVLKGARLRRASARVAAQRRRARPSGRERDAVQVDDGAALDHRSADGTVGPVLWVGPLVPIQETNHRATPRGRRTVAYFRASAARSRS